METNNYFYQTKKPTDDELASAVALQNSITPSTHTTRIASEPLPVYDNEASDNATNVVGAYNAEVKRQYDVETATVSDKLSGIGELFKDTTAAGVVDYFDTESALFRKDNENFKQHFGEDEIYKLMKQYGLHDISSYNALTSAVSTEHANDIAQLEKRKQDSKNIVNSSLSSSEQMWYGLAAEVLSDPTTYLSGGSLAAAKILTKAGRMTATANKMLARGNAFLDVGYGATIGATDDDMSLAEGLLIYGAVGAIDYKIIRGMDKTDIAAVASSSKHSYTTTEASSFERQNSLREKVAAHTENGIKVDTRNAKMSEKIDLEDTVDTLKGDAKVEAEAKIAKLDKEIKQLDDVRPVKPLTAGEQAVKIAEISSNKKLSVNIGFRKLTTMAESIRAKAKLSKSIITDEAKTLLHTTISDIKELGVKIEQDIADVKKSVQAVSSDDAKLGEDILNVYKNIHEAGYISKGAYKQIEASFKKGKDGKYKPLKIEAIPTKDGKNVKLKINNKVVKVVGASALVAGSLNAGDFTDTVDEGIGAFILAGILAVSAPKLLKTLTAKKMAEKASSTIKRMKNMDNTRVIRSKLGEFASKSRVSLMETIAPMQKNMKGTEGEKIVNDFYFNPLDADGGSIEISKRQLYQNKYNAMQKEMLPIYKDWLANLGINKLQNIKSLFENTTYRMKFNKEVFEYAELGLHQENENIAKAVEISQRYFGKTFDEMVESDVKGANKMHKVDGFYMPRVVDKIGFQNKIAHITDESYDAIVKALARTLTKTKNAREVADIYLKNIVSTADAGKTYTKDSRAKLIQQLEKTGLNEDEVNDVIETLSGQFGRTKSRLHMDYSKFGKVEINFKAGTNSAESATIGYDDIFMTDVNSLASTLFNGASGHTAMALKGYKSVDDLLGVVEDLKADTAYKKTLANDIKATVGIPTIDYSITANKVAKLFANTAIAKGMVLSTISLMSEGVIALQHMVKSSGVIGTMKKLAHNIRNELGDDSFAMSSIVQQEDGFGYGMQRYGATYGQSRTFDEFGNVDSKIDKYTKYSEIARDITLHTLPFSRTSDFIERLNFQDVMDTLHGYLNGNIKLSEAELSAFNISKHMQNKLQSVMELNKQGNVKFFDYTKWSLKDKDELKQLVDRMMMKRQNRTTMATTGSFTRHSAIGVALMPMLSYPMSAYSNLGAFLGRGILQGDTFAMTQSMLWFQAGIVQSAIRNGIEGRENDDTMLMYYGMMNTPFSGIISTPVGLMSSPTSKMTSDIASVLDLYNYVKEQN